MEEQVNQLPTWGVPFLVVLELIVFVVTARIGRLIVICQHALQWVEKQKTSSILNVRDFTEGVSIILEEELLPILVIFIRIS